MNMLTYLFRESRRLLLIATLASFASGIAGAALAKVVSDTILGPGPSGQAAAWFFGLCLAYLVAKACAELSLMHLVQDAILRMRVELSRKLLATPLKKLQELGKSELLAILTNDIGTFVQAFQTLPLAFGNAVLMLACCAYLAWLSGSLFLLFGAFLVLGLLGYHLAEQRPLRRMTALREQLDRLYEHFRGLTEGTKELQLNADRGRFFVDRVIHDDARRFRGLFVGTMTSYVWVGNVGLVLFYVLIGLLLFVAPLWLSAGAATITTFALILLFMVRPISDLMIALPLLRQAAVSLDKIRQLEGSLGEAEECPDPDPFDRATPLRLELRDVAHRYPGPLEDHSFTLGPLTLAVQQGEVLMVVGANGSGKTTLAMLLLGFYAPEAGSVVLNGVAVTRENLASYRRYFSAVFADFHLFEQLLQAGDETVRRRAEHYVDKLQMAHKVKVEGGRFSTIDLSSGQRKRLALVSAYLEDRAVYLFDEWAADQDPAFKRVFYTELLPELKARGKTVIVITHDDAYFRCADRIVKLEDGRLQPLGPMEQVLRPAATAEPIPG